MRIEVYSFSVCVHRAVVVIIVTISRSRDIRHGRVQGADTLRTLVQKVNLS